MPDFEWDENKNKYLKLEMKLNPEIISWINSNKIDVNLLVEKLVEDVYRTSKLFENNKV
jgi:hypothetical protein